ncbi:hypothetical protein C2E20_3682 [Micractinium conductrix]|uniref:Uncharacterized protein n=1 Tax=Micractinium conductrix TaxID=554055 RepID=A0A2P6VGA3_9CHLO|nr:hypothetical protein C2E20_3682 [Micractinium conductrix]|eukprot:PSC73120.1 hypothetical protein C2E20_3682 [Micractinium conductrix]
MQSRALLPLLLAAVAVGARLAAAAAAAATPDELALALRPAGCTAGNCAACSDYLVFVENLTSLFSPDPPVDPCGSDDLYTPVPIRFDANCQLHWPSAWRCMTCCSADCGSGGCVAGQGAFKGSHGCASCPPLAVLRTLQAPATTCKSCFGSNRCFQEAPTKYRICDVRTNVTGKDPPPPPRKTQPAALAPPPPAARPAASPSPPPGRSPLSPEMLSPEPLPPAEAPAPEGEVSAPAPAPAPTQVAPSSAPPPSPPSSLPPPLPPLAAPPPSGAGMRSVGALLLTLVAALAALAAVMQ